MSRLYVELYPRGDGFLAIALREGELLADAGICGEASERRAAIGAIHSYFNRQERPAAVVVHEPHPADESWVTNHEQRPQRGGRLVYTDETSITRALREAVTTDGTFHMVYRDQGGNLTERRITVSKVEDRHRGVAGFPETYAVAFDLDKDEPRTFRVDRIERLEAI